MFYVTLTQFADGYTPVPLRGKYCMCEASTYKSQFLGKSDKFQLFFELKGEWKNLPFHAN